MEIFSNLKNLKNDKLILLGAIICLIYFVCLVTLSYYNVNIKILGVFIEPLTIPFIILLLFLTFFLSIKTLKTSSILNQVTSVQF